MLVLQTIFDDIDITAMKIYYDTEKQQYKHKFYCSECKVPVFCVCYDSLEEAYLSNDEGMWCEKCTLRFAMLDEGQELDDAFYMIMKSMQGERIDKLIDCIISLLTKEEIEVLMRETWANCDPSDISGAICK